MSEAVRRQLADLASTVDGITVAPYFRQLTRPGEGAIRRDRMARSENGFGYVNTWQVVILLPQDLADAEKWFDEKVPALVAAVEQLMGVASVTPQQINAGGKNLPCVFIEAHYAEQE